MHSPKASNRCKMHRFGTTSFGAHGVLRFTVADIDKMASADLESLAGLGPVRDERHAELVGIVLRAPDARGKLMVLFSVERLLRRLIGLSNARLNEIDEMAG